MIMKDFNGFGERLLELRKRRGMSQEELAEVLKVSRQTVSSWETGRTVPNAELLREIAECMGMDAGALLEGETLPRAAEQKNIGRALPWLALALALAHLVMAFLGKVPMICVMVSPVLIAAMYGVMSLAFRAGIRSGDFSMIAGYDPKEPREKTVRKLDAAALYCGWFAAVCELLFFMVYGSERQMLVSMIISGVYITCIVATTVVVEIKYK